MSLALAASAGLMTATPAHAGPLDFLKNEVSKAAKKEAKRAIEAGTQRAVRVAVSDVSRDGIDESAAEGESFRQEGHTTVPTADDIQSKPQAHIGGAGGAGKVSHNRVQMERANAKLSQNGTTVGTASEVQAPQTEEQRPQRAKLSQNGTTVATANEVQAPTAEQRPQRARLSQNGTTVETASEVQAPESEGQAGLLLPAVQKVREPARR
ncbi:hypothetical protein [Altererythrobacter sp. MF3-039]|uniref:hypothetical protein n=1 Tax=Altererythrobacter sp. MF3-039 TaxID=3252901 RepID=UPI00390CB655